MTTTDSAVAANAVHYDIDPMHSSAHFSVRHLMIAHVRGQFTSLSGTLVYDTSHPENSQVNVTIDAKSIQTSQAQRDDHLRTPEFLDTAQYPTITFVSTSVTPIESGHVHVIGNLTLHGVSKEVTLDVTGSTDEIKDVWGSWRTGFTAHTQIQRSEFGLTWNAALETGGFVISDAVDITLDVQFVRKS